MAAGSARGTAWQDGARRVLEYAIAASLALHGLALLSLPLLPSPQARSVPVGLIELLNLQACWWLLLQTLV